MATINKKFVLSGVLFRKTWHVTALTVLFVLCSISIAGAVPMVNDVTGFWEPAKGFANRGHLIVSNVTERWAGVGNEAVGTHRIRR